MSTTHLPLQAIILAWAVMNSWYTKAEIHSWLSAKLLEFGYEYPGIAVRALPNHGRRLENPRKAGLLESR